MHNTGKIKNNSKLQANAGVALFIAILTAGIVLSIGMSALNITLKELILSSIGRESSVAFYAADTGIECALLWDLTPPAPFTESVFATSSASGPPPSGSGINCINTDISSVWNYNGPPARTADAATTTFTLQFSPDIGDPCAIVLIAKYEDGSGNVRTKIDVRGLNSCDPARQRRVERGIRVSY